MLDDKNGFNTPEEQHNDQPSADYTQAPQDPVMQLPEIPVAAAPADPMMFDAPPLPPRKPRSGIKMFAAAVALVAMGAAIGGGTGYGLARKFQQNSLPIGLTLNQSNLKTVSAPSTAEVGASVIPGIWQRVSPSVVRIDTVTGRGRYSGAGTGSGFVVDAKGYILTNNHVIDGATSIKVKFVDGTVLDGKVVGADKYKDVALVQVDPGSRALVPVTLGNSDNVQVGELAVAIGSPFGQEFTVTSGIVSAVNRTLSEDDRNPLYTIPGGIQTDAAINPGNSGGPLLNANGEVIGINTMIDTGNTGVAGNLGIGFALPINLAKDLMPNLMQGKSSAPGFLGVASEDLTAQIAKQIGVDTSLQGAVVDTVQKDSPAEKAGLQEPVRLGKTISADVITAVDGKAIKSSSDLVAAIAAHKPGDTVKLTVVRGKDKVELTATLIARPADADN